MIIGNYEFQGPFSSVEELEDRPGVYIVLCNLDDELHEVLLVDIDVLSVRKNLLQKDKSDQWRNNCSGKLEFVVCYREIDELSYKRLLHEIKACVEEELN